MRNRCQSKGTAENMYMYIYEVQLIPIHNYVLNMLTLYIHERSVIETRQSKATTPEDNSLFLKRKRRAASGGT